MKKDFKKIKRNRGMTLVELMVVCAIFVILSSISIFNYVKFKSYLSLQNLTDEVALSIRKVQGYAIGAKGLSSGGVDAFKYAYGISFSKTEKSATTLPLSPYSKSFVIFTDVSDNKIYNITSSSGSNCGSPTDTNECLEVLGIKSSDKISDVKYFTSSNTTGASIGNGSLNILFKRPNPDAYFCYMTSSVCDPASNSISHVTIYLEDGSSDSSNIRTKTVTVWNTGQIHIN